MIETAMTNSAHARRLAAPVPGQERWGWCGVGSGRVWRSNAIRMARAGIFMLATLLLAACEEKCPKRIGHDAAVAIAREFLQSRTIAEFEASDDITFQRFAKGLREDGVTEADYRRMISTTTTTGSLKGLPRPPCGNPLLFYGGGPDEIAVPGYHVEFSEMVPVADRPAYFTSRAISIVMTFCGRIFGLRYFGGSNSRENPVFWPSLQPCENDQ